MSMKPLHDRVVIKALEEELTSAGGIVIPDNAKEKPMRGEVVAIGRGKMVDIGQVLPLAVKQGDKVWFGKYAGTELKLEGVDYVVMREDDIMAVVEK